MPLLRFQTTLIGKSMLARDDFVTSVHLYSSDDFTHDQMMQGAGACAAFFQSIAVQLSNQISSEAGAHHVKVYDVSAPKQSPPLLDRSFTLEALGMAGGNPLPNEVALCLSYYADPQLHIARQSWRGRCFLGPWMSNVSGTTASGPGRPSPDLLPTLLGHAKDWFNNLNEPAYQIPTNIFGVGSTTGLAPGTGGKVQVYSRLHNRSFPVRSVGMDDAWDTMRSRGLRPTAMTKQTLSDPGGEGHDVPPQPA